MAAHYRHHHHHHGDLPLLVVTAAAALTTALTGIASYLLTCCSSSCTQLVIVANLRLFRSVLCSRFEATLAILSTSNVRSFLYTSYWQAEESVINREIYTVVQKSPHFSISLWFLQTLTNFHNIWHIIYPVNL